MHMEILFLSTLPFSSSRYGYSRPMIYATNTECRQ